MEDDPAVSIRAYKMSDQFLLMCLLKRTTQVNIFSLTVMKYYLNKLDNRIKSNFKIFKHESEYYIMRSPIKNLFTLRVRNNRRLEPLCILNLS